MIGCSPANGVHLDPKWRQTHACCKMHEPRREGLCANRADAGWPKSLWLRGSLGDSLNQTALGALERKREIGAVRPPIFRSSWIVVILDGVAMSGADRWP